MVEAKLIFLSFLFSLLFVRYRYMMTESMQFSCFLKTLVNVEASEVVISMSTESCF